ncbi:HD-GYP domain-containing protein [Pseudaeromonas paramecii]|uniref:HD-GYP domain-containing protein n=1 Tax=Pseudaeromonas paramecii TaxID=2138166 RepID=A0ABP8QGJ7_9GAMM
METTQSTLRRLTLAQLQPGMFVTRILQQQGDTRLSQSGLVGNQGQIRQMAQLGVLVVEVDLARSKQVSQAQAQPAPSTPPARNKPNLTKAQHRERVRRLYQEAKGLQGKLFDQLKAGEPIAMAPLEAMADELVDSIFEHNDALMCLSRIREKDSYLMEHSLNVGIHLANFGRHLGLPRQVLKELAIGGMLHDTGKILIPDAVLHKPGRLTEDEFAIMQTHVRLGQQILDASPGFSPIMRSVLSGHHERLDGQGYPAGLTAEALDQYARMASVVDVYDALTADRCYKPGMPASQALRILLQGAGSQFDSQLVAQFIKCLGIYPVGSLVKLDSGRLALVMERNDKTPLQPLVKILYSTKSSAYLEVRLLDLSRPGETDRIESAADPRHYGIDLAPFL